MSAAAARTIVPPLLADYTAALDALSDGDDAGDQQLHVIAATRALLAGEWFGELIAALIRAMEADPYFEPPYPSVDSAVQRGFVLVDHRLATVAVLSVAAGSGTRSSRTGSVITFGGKVTVTRVLRAGDLHVDRYEADDPGENFTLATAAPCRHIGRERLSAGAIIEADGCRQALTFAIGGCDALMIRAEIRAGGAALRRDYDAASGALIGLGMVDEVPARTQLMLSLLRTMRRADAAPLFASVVEQAPFFMRWYAMRELLALDADIALPLLARLAEEDPHPDVRNASRQTRAELARRHPALFCNSSADRSARSPCPA